MPAQTHTHKRTSGAPPSAYYILALKVHAFILCLKATETTSSWCFQFCSTLVLTLQDFCIDSWKRDFTVFLREIRNKYDKHIFGKRSIITYTGVSKQGGMFGAFHEVSIKCL